MTRQCRFIQPLLMRTAPDPTSLRPRDLGELLYLGKKFAGLSAQEMALTLRFWTMSISEFLDEYFETDVIKANFALSGIIGTALGPMSPGTAYVLLHHYMGEVDGSVGAWGYARGGMGAVTKALAASFKASGGTIRTGAEVDHVLVGRGKARGVVLAGGADSHGTPVGEGQLLAVAVRASHGAVDRKPCVVEQRPAERDLGRGHGIFRRIPGHGRVGGQLPIVGLLGGVAAREQQHGGGGEDPNPAPHGGRPFAAHRPSPWP